MVAQGIGDALDWPAPRLRTRASKQTNKQTNKAIACQFGDTAALMAA
jgi:hypothetical protein